MVQLLMTSSPVRNSMKQTATVERTTLGLPNPIGGPTAGAVVTSTVPCRAWEDTQEEVTSDGKWLTLSRWKMRVPLGADIEEDDQVTIGSTLLLVETPPVERRGHKLVTLEILQREIQHAPLPIVWGSLGLFWDSLELAWEDVA